ncbi:unnamed protein product [Tilletia controversa]|uniref:Tryptophan dimethylallyltransferase n=1 Tax=Tilletia controversa TaxID=13291 RepID=A0A8X7MYI5_9BASI|nr:hypothetical protein CF328_g262 [Tilletia controversa]KAE8254645.1 hypothetical protein A4X06_0g804 [Tilletia controversa]CAD6910953.1 unnamed protein product [Tilletia controversa]CAD6983123.1 unnamed protein product [Tilletia controversa]
MSFPSAANSVDSLLTPPNIDSPQRPILLRNDLPSTTGYGPSPEDLDFWRGAVASPLLVMLQQARYSAEAINVFENFLEVYVLPALGCAPQKTARGWEFAFPSFMNDNHSPVEIGLSWTKGQPSVKFSIEPIGCPSDAGSSMLSNLHAAERLLQRLQAGGLGSFERLRDLAQCCISEEQDETSEARSQVFVAFDLQRSGNVLVKAYLMPHARASSSQFDVVDQAIQSVKADGTAWSTIESYYHSLYPSERPEAVILSTDCSNDSTARIKVYFRYRTNEIASVLQHMSLGGRIASGWERTLPQLWHAVLSEQKQDGTTSLRTIDDRSETTGGVLIYYDFSRSEDEATSKIYLPVRHWASTDQAIARGLSDYLRQSVHNATSSTCNSEQPLLYDDVLRLFADPIELEGCRGLQNYVCAGQKKDGRIDLSIYLNPLPRTSRIPNSAVIEAIPPASEPAALSQPDDFEEDKNLKVVANGQRLTNFLRRSPRIL